MRSRAASIDNGMLRRIERMEAAVPDGAADLVTDLYRRLPDARIYGLAARMGTHQPDRRIPVARCRPTFNVKDPYRRISPPPANKPGRSRPSDLVHRELSGLLGQLADPGGAAVESSSMITVHIYGSTAPDGADDPFKDVHDCEIDLNPAKVVAILGDHGYGKGVIVLLEHGVQIVVSNETRLSFGKRMRDWMLLRSDR